MYCLLAAMLAKKVLDHDLTTASGTWVLYPNAGGNMHRFVAGEEGPCAFLDVLTPPYSSPSQRQSCTFYQDFPYELHPSKQQLHYFNQSFLQACRHHEYYNQELYLYTDG